MGIHLKHIIEFWPGDWGGQLGKDNESFFDNNQHQQ